MINIRGLAGGDAGRRRWEWPPIAQAKPCRAATCHPTLRRCFARKPNHGPGMRLIPSRAPRAHTVGLRHSLGIWESPYLALYLSGFGLFRRPYPVVAAANQAA